MSNQVIPAQKLNIAGVRIIKLNNILTRSGLMNEVFRSSWFEDIKVNQINWVELNPQGLTDWHCHAVQTDRLIGVSGNIKLCLFDDRPDSVTRGATDVIRIGIAAPIMVVFPPGIWHGLRNESGVPAAYLNVVEHLYDHEKPDNFRQSHDSSDIPVKL
ncbi:MAG: hypothetical protein ABIO88_08645 [Burkholderiaceae bacterium]